MFEIFDNNILIEPTEPIEKLLYNRFIELIKEYFKEYKDKKPGEFPYFFLGVIAYGFFDVEKILKEEENWKF